MPRILVDGYNLLLRHGRGATQADREQLERDAYRFHGLRGDTVWLVFDAREGSGTVSRSHHPGVRLLFAAGDADRAIVNRIRGDRSPADLLVITDDRALAESAREHGAKTESTDWFLNPPPRRRHRARPKQRSPSNRPAPSAADVEYWLDVFSRPGRDDDDW